MNQHHIEVDMRNDIKNRNIEGNVYGFLLVRMDLGIQNYSDSNIRYRKVIAECLNCASGIKTYNFAHLKSGRSKSCGCYQKQKVSLLKTRHGLIKSPEYKTWLAIKQRCFDPNYKLFDYYGGRGITVCKEWAESFEIFYAEMKGKPPNGEIDRIDNNKNYEPGNCRWVTRSENSFNQRKRKNNKSGKTGVYWHKGTKKWSAVITVKGEQKYLGLFENIESAIIRRKEAELEFFGFTKD